MKKEKEADPQSVALSGVVALIGAEHHSHAARRLKAKFPELEWVHYDSPDNVPEHVATVSLHTDPDLHEGAFTTTANTEGSAPKLEVAGGPFSGVIYGVEELIQQKGTSAKGSTAFTVATGVHSPDLPYRSFWTWDHSTNWNLEQIGQQEIGVFNPYGKPPEGFLSDYTRAVDFCSENRIGGIIVYGFLRDSHGGVDTAKELCDYANERGVRIIPGIAIGAYGGVYWEGSNKYNLASWLGDNPGTRAQAEGAIGFQIEDLDFPLSFPQSEYTVSACPSDPKTIEWMEEAVSWLAETFAIGGVNIESGDYGVCGCDRCLARRGDNDDPSRRQEQLESWSHADLTHNFPRLFDAITSRRSDAWVYCELQWDNLLDKSSGRAFEAMPPDAIYQHTVNRSYWNRVRSELAPGALNEFPQSHNALRTHIASQWSGDYRTERYRNNSIDMMGLAREGAALGFKGLTIWGEASPHNVPVELSYLAFSRFGFDASLQWDEFFTDTVAPLFGGHAEATQFVDILSKADEESRPNKKAISALQNLAVEALSQANDQSVSRWIWLAEHLSRRQRMAPDS
jgi:hypothetical protein